MSKKTFTTAPRPRSLSAEEIDAYVSGGAGHDTAVPPRPEAAPRAQAGAGGATRRLSLDLPEELHRRFKAACAANGRKMGAELAIFIEARTAELEAERNK